MEADRGEDRRKEKLAKEQQSTRCSFPFLCDVLYSMEPTLTAVKELDAFYGRFVPFGYSIFRSDLPQGESTTDPVSLRRRLNSKLSCCGKNPCFVALWPASDENHRSRSGDLYNYTTETRLHFVKEQLPRATCNEI